MPEAKERKAGLIVAGYGHQVEKHILPNGSFRVLADPSGTKIFDINPARVSGVTNARVADCTRPLPADIPIDDGTIAFISTPDHIRVIDGLAKSGVKKIIAEKPMVNKRNQLPRLRRITNENDIKLFPIDFYYQKAYPLLALTGAIKKDDPRLTAVKTDNEQSLDQLHGKLSTMIGKIKKIDITIVEGGNFGIPDLAKRKWLQRDRDTGGMLLDLGTHALYPLFASGIVNPDNLKILSARREKLYKNNKAFVPAGKSPEIIASAIMRAGDVPIHMTLAKTFEGPFREDTTAQWEKRYPRKKLTDVTREEGIWGLVIEGEKGNLRFDLRTGGKLKVTYQERDELKNITLSLTGRDPYSQVFYDAKNYFNGDSAFDSMRDMSAAIRNIDRIKAISNRPGRKFRRSA